MKKHILLLVFMGIGLLGFSQKSRIGFDRSVFSIGPKAGISHALIMPDDNMEFFTVWNGGLTSTYAPGERFGLGIDVLYSAEGSKTKGTIAENGGGEITRNLDYIRVPVKAILFFGDEMDAFRPKISLGPTVGFLVNEENSTGAEDFDMGAQVAIGFNYQMAEAIWLNFDVDYYQGLMDVYKLQNDNQYNGRIGVNVGVAFGL